MPLEGKLTVLREEREGDLPFLLELRNDLETQAWSKSLPPAYTLPMYQNRFDKAEFSYDPREARFVIVARETGDLAGTITYSSLDKRMGTAIGIIVAKQYWGTGIAFDAQEVLLRFLFEELGLRVVRLYTHSGNPAAVQLAKKSGFRTSARQREAIYKSGGLYDNLNMDLLREEFYAGHPDLVDNLPQPEP